MNADVSRDLAVSAGREWSTLVTTAVLGTDRRPLPAPPPGWAALTAGDDVAVELLDRAAAVATARRCGVRPDDPPLRIEHAPGDDRPACSTAAGHLLSRMLSGVHDILLPEWISLCQAAGFQPPPHLIPALLLRGRRHPPFDVAARDLIGPRAHWLAEAMPELGVRPLAPTGSVERYLPPPAPPDSGAVVSALIQTFLDRSATWAAAAQLRTVVAAVDPAWLRALVLELNRAPFNPVTERTRVDLLGVAQMRHEMIASLAPPSPPPPPPSRRF